MFRFFEILFRPLKNAVRLCEMLGRVLCVAISVTQSRITRLSGFTLLITFASWSRMLS